MKTILFVCTGNTCRSSMAEALFKSKLEELKSNPNRLRDWDSVQVISAGTAASPRQKASPQAIEVMEERNISLRDHRAQPLSEELIDEADLILTMTSNHKKSVIRMKPEAEKKVFTLKEYIRSLDETDAVLDKMNDIFKRIQEKKDVFMSKNQKRLEELKRKREGLLRELDSIALDIKRIEDEFLDEIGAEQDEIARLKGEIPNLDITDPFGQPLNVYRNSAKEIEECIEKLIEKGFNI